MGFVILICFMILTLIFLAFSPLEGVGGDCVAGRCGVSPQRGWRKTKVVRVENFQPLQLLAGDRGILPPLILISF